MLEDSLRLLGLPLLVTLDLNVYSGGFDSTAVALAGVFERSPRLQTIRLEDRDWDVADPEGVPRDVIWNLPNATDADLFSSDAHPFFEYCCGRLVAPKLKRKKSLRPRNHSSLAALIRQDCMSARLLERLLT